jgi:hypothetical protein
MCNPPLEWSHPEWRFLTSDELRILVVIDEYTRECLALEVARQLRSEDVLYCLAGLFVDRGTPDYIRSDNGPASLLRVLSGIGCGRSV